MKCTISICIKNQLPVPVCYIITFGVNKRWGFSRRKSVSPVGSDDDRDFLDLMLDCSLIPKITAFQNIVCEMSVILSRPQCVRISKVIPDDPSSHQ